MSYKTRVYVIKSSIICYFLHLHVMKNYTRTLYYILYITYYFFYFLLHIYILSLLHRIFQCLQQAASTQPYKINHYTWPSATIIAHWWCQKSSISHTVLTCSRQYLRNKNKENPRSVPMWYQPKALRMLS